MGLHVGLAMRLKEGLFRFGVYISKEQEKRWNVYICCRNIFLDPCALYSRWLTEATIRRGVFPPYNPAECGGALQNYPLGCSDRTAIDQSLLACRLSRIAILSVAWLELAHWVNW